MRSRQMRPLCQRFVRIDPLGYPRRSDAPLCPGRCWWRGTAAAKRNAALTMCALTCFDAYESLLHRT